MTYSYEMEWDSGSKSIYFLGGDHNGCEKFITYAALTNSWSVQASAPVTQACSCSGSTTQNHSYNYHALDELGGYYYAYGYGDYALHGYNIKDHKWDRRIELPGEPYYSRGNWSIEQTTHGLTLFSYESTWAYDFSSQEWNELSRGTYVGADDLHVISQYAPFYEITLFGGGDGNNVLYRLDKNGNVASIDNSPIGSISIHPNPPNGVVAVVDP